MLEWLAAYGMFFAKVFTIVVGILLTVGGVLALSLRQSKPEKGELLIKNLNTHYDNLKSKFEEQLLNKNELKKQLKEKTKQVKAEKKSKKSNDERSRKIFVIDFDGDIKAQETEPLAKKIDGILLAADHQTDEVVLRLESPGGVVHGYGLAASQLKRITESKVKLTICVDKVAASGGYMMACVADNIIAAPFAIIGSIGVVAQLPNFNKLLKKHDIDYDIYTAGEYKRTVTMLGENTEAGKKKLNDDLQETHVLFKQMIAENRPNLDVDAVATGEIWYGKQAIAKNLIDEIGTSNDYLLTSSHDAKIYHVDYIKKEKISDKLGLSLASIIEQALLSLSNKVGKHHQIF